MDFDFFQPITNAISADRTTPGQLGYHLLNQSPDDFFESKICLIGVIDETYGIACESIRRSLYSYFTRDKFPLIYDLGNIELQDGEVYDKKRFNSIMKACIEHDKLLLFMGGSVSFLYDIQQAYAYGKHYVNLGTVQSSFSIEENEGNIDESNFLFRIFASKPNYLFHYSQLGFQNYLVNSASISLLNEMNFDATSLGEIRNNIQHTEPLIRDLDLLGISTKAIKQGEAVGQPECSPNGLYAEELAQLCKYAGMAEKLTAVGFFDYDALYDANGVTAHLIAQSIWCFIEGYAERKGENPHINSNSFVKFIVHNDEMDLELIFIKSETSGRWWIQMPEDKAILKQQFYLPCTYEDYQTALDGDIPVRWLKGFQKLSQAK